MDNKKKKLGGKSFKLECSNSTYRNPPSLLPSDKRSKEFVLAMIFSQLLIKNGEIITKVQINEDDSYGKPDILITINGENDGIQITKMSLNDPLRRIHASEYKTKELLELITNSISVRRPLNIYIYLKPDSKKYIPKGTDKQKRRFAEFICKEIQKNESKIYDKNFESLFIPVNNDSLKKLGDAIVIVPIEEGNYSLFPGKDNIFINYNFDNHNWDESDLNKEIDRIINEKSKSSGDILLIWGEQFELLYQEKEISDILIKRFKDTNFKNVFFLTFCDKPGIFYESCALYGIKIKRSPNFIK